MKKPNERKNVMKKRPLLTNEDGSVMVVALALLMLLTLIGISATTTSMIEIQISGAKKAYTDHLFQAEGAAMECVQLMQVASDLSTEPYFNDERTRTQDEIQNLILNLNFANSDTPSIGTGHATLYQGVVGSMKMGQPNLHAYAVYGWHDTPQGRVIVELGYRRAFE
jgi:Tfp pilus assembly protein PilX